MGNKHGVYLAVAISFALCLTGLLLSGTDIVGMLLLGVSYLAAVGLIGEYILPLFLHLSSEHYDLPTRVSREMEMLSRGEETFWSQSFRVFVTDDDAQCITALGFRSLVITRGCYNMRSGEFHCVLQEAMEQRKNLRSVALLYATLGNIIFFQCRFFCRVGRVLFRIMSIPISMVIAAISDGGFQGGFRIGTIVAEISDRIYSVFARLFIAVSNASIYLYTPAFDHLDRDIDQQLVNLNLRNVLGEIIAYNQGIGYSGTVPRENCIIFRSKAAKRLEFLATAERTNSSHQRPTVAPEQRRTQNSSVNHAHTRSIMHSQTAHRVEQHRLHIIDETQQSTARPQPDAGRRSSGARLRVIDDDSQQ